MPDKDMERSIRVNRDPELETSILKEQHALLGEARMVALAFEALRRQLGRPPSDEEVAKELEFKSADWKRLTDHFSGLFDLVSRVWDRQEHNQKAGSGRGDGLFNWLEVGMEQRLEAAIDRLSNNEGLALRLRVREKMDSAEAASVMGVEASTVEQLWVSADLKLRAILGI